MKIIDKLDNCKIPEWAMSAIFNSDYSGLFGNDIMFLDTWLAWLEKKNQELESESFVVVQDDDYQYPYFDENPEFGLPCNVYDCTVLFLRRD